MWCISFGLEVRDGRRAVRLAHDTPAFDLVPTSLIFLIVAYITRYLACFSAPGTYYGGP